MDRKSKILGLASEEDDDLLEPDLQARTEAPNSFAHLARQQQVSTAVLQKNHLVAGMRNDMVADAYRLLRTRVLNAMRRDGWNVLGITSAGGQEGKSLTAANLAISMAREPDATVLLVDADLRRPSLHRYFGLDVEFGLAEYLRSDLPIEQVLIAPGIERLLIIPGSMAAGDSSELLGSRKMGALIKECKGRSDLRCIIVDLPPVLVGDDALVLSSHLDAVLLVIDEGRTLATELSRSLELLDRVQVVGSVLNRSPDLSQRYYDIAPRQRKWGDMVLRKN